MKFERRYTVFMSIMFFIILNLGINAQNEDNHNNNDETNLEQPNSDESADNSDESADNSDESADNSDESADNSDESADNSDESADNSDEKTPEEQYNTWLQKLSSNVESESAEAKNNLKNNLPQTLDTLLRGIANDNLSIKHTCINILIENNDLKDAVSATFTSHLAQELDADALSKIITTLVNWNIASSKSEIAKLLHHEVPAIRIQSVKALSHFDGKESLDSFFDALPSEKYPDVKAEMYQQIVSLGDDNHFLKMLLVVENENFSEQKEVVLKPIVSCATKYGKQIGIDVLLAIANQAGDDSVRLSAIENVLPLLNRENVGILVDFLWDDNLDIRKKVFSKLSNLSKKSFGYNPEAPLMDRIASISRWQDWKQIDDALYWLSSDNKEESQSAASKIESHGVAVVPMIAEVYPSASASGKKKILQILAKYPIPSALATIEQALNETDTEIKNLAISSLFNAWKDFGNKNALTSLRNLFEKDASNIFLAFKLAEAKDQGAIEYLTKIIEDPQQVETAIYYTTPSFFSLLGPHIAAQNETSAKVVDYLSHTENILAISVLVGHFKELNKNDKVVLLHRLVEHPAQFSKLVSAFTSEQEVSVIDAFSHVIATLQSKDFFDALSVKLVAFPENSKVIAALKAIATAENAASLIETFGKVENNNTQQEIVRIIGSFKTDASKAFLKTTVESNNTQVKFVALHFYLSSLTEGEKKSYVAGLIAKEKDKNSLVSLYKASSSLYTKEDYKTLNETFATEEDTNVKSTLLEIVVSLDKAAASSTLLSIITAKDGDLALKTKAIELFSKEKQSTEVLEKLVASYNDASDTSLKAQLLFLIANTSKDESTKLAGLSLANKVNFDIYSALVKIDSATAREKFASVLENSGSEDKKRVLEASLSILNKKHVNDLLPYVINDDPDIYDAAFSAIKKITNQEMTLEELNLWNQNYQNVNKNIAVVLSSNEDTSEAVAKLSEQKDLATEELISSFSHVGESQKIKIATLLSSWTDANVYKFMGNLVHNQSSSLRQIAYTFLQKNSKSSFRKDAPVLYLLEEDSLAKITLLAFLLETYPNKYENDLQKYVSNDNEAVQQRFFDIIKGKSYNNLYSQLLQGNATAQSKVLSFLAEKPGNENLKLLANALMKSSNEKATVYLEALANYKSVPAEAKNSRENFVTWWLTYEKELAKEQQIFELLGKLEQNNRFLKKEIEQQLKALNLSAAKILDYMSDSSVSQRAKENLLVILSDNAQEKYLDVFNAYAQQDNKPLRKSAIKALAQIGYDKNVDILQSCLQDEDSQIRLFVARSLGQSSANNANDLLLSSLSDIDFRVREEVYYWLIERKAVDKELAIEMFAENQPPSIQEMSINHLRNIGETSVIPKLIFYLDNPFEEIRATAYEALVSLSGEGFEFDAKTDDRTESVSKWNSWWQSHKQELEIKDLVESFTHEGINPEAVQKRLVSYGISAVPMLLEKLNDPRGIVRKEVLLTLKEMNNRNHTTNVAKLVKDNDIQIRAEALATLEKLTGSKVEVTVDLEAEKQWQAAIADINSWWDNRETALTQEKEQTTASLRDKVKELMAKFSDEKVEHASVTKQILELGNGVTPFVEQELASENNLVVASALNILGELNAKQSTPQVIVLLQKDEVRKEVEKTLKKLMGDLPIESVDAIERKEQVKNLSKWWEAEQKSMENTLMEEVDTILNNVEKEGNSDTFVKALVETKSRQMLEDYLADNRISVKQAIVSALIDLNNKSSVLSLQTYLRGTDFSERKLMITAIRALTGEAFLPQEPKDEEEWEQVYSLVTKWSENWQSNKEQELATVSSTITKAADEGKVDDAIKSTQAFGADASAKVHELLTSKNEKYRLAALKLVASVASTNDVAAIISLIDDNNKEIRDLAQKTILSITKQEKLPSLPLNEVWGVQIAKLQNHWNQMQEASIDKAELTLTLNHLALDEVKAEDASKILNDKGAGVISAISPLLKNQSDNIRLGAVKALALIGNFEQGRAVATCLSDTNVVVRQKAYETVAAWAKEKMPVALSPSKDADNSWKENASNLVDTWLESERKAQQEQVAKQMEVDAEKIKNLTEIWTLEQLADVQAFIEYIRNSSKDIRDRASDVLNDGPLQEAIRKDSVAYNEEAISLEEINANYDEYNTWLTSKKKDIESKTEEVQSKLVELESQKNSISGINTLNDYEDARDIIAEMDASSDPRALTKLKEILDQYGCDTSKFNPYDTIENRSDQLYEIEKNSLYQIKKRLEKQQGNSATELATIGKALDLKSANTEKELEQVSLLIATLEKDIDYSLRAKIARVLTTISGNDYGYKAASKDNSSAIKGWQEWIVTSKESIADSRALFEKDIEEVSALLQAQQSVKSIDDAAKAELLIQVLADENKALREKAISALAALNAGDSFGYDANGNAENWKASTAKWNTWLQAKKTLFSELNKLDKAALEVKEVVKTGSAVDAMGVLIAALKSDKEELRSKAFATLEEYVRNYAQNQVRESFGYDPKAPKETLVQPIADWQKWYDEKMLPIQKEELANLDKILAFAKTLVNDKLNSSSGVYAAEALIESLKSDSLIARKASLNALQGYTNASYSYDPTVKPTEQESSLSLWNAWLQYHKENVVQKYYAKYLENNLSSAQKRTRAVEMLGIVKQEVVLPEVRGVAVSWLNKEANKNLLWSADTKKAVADEFDAWFKGQEPKYIIDSASSELAKGVNNSNHVATLDALIGYLDADDESVRKAAIGALNKVSSKTFSYNATEDKDKREKSKGEINAWVTEQKVLAPIKEKANALKSIIDITRNDVKDLVAALSSKNENVRKLAIETLSPYLPQPVQYQYNGSEKERKNAIFDIESWMDEL